MSKNYFEDISKCLNESNEAATKPTVISQISELLKKSGFTVKEDQNSLDFSGKIDGKDEIGGSIETADDGITYTISSKNGKTLDDDRIGTLEIDPEDSGSIEDAVNQILEFASLLKVEEVKEDKYGYTGPRTWKQYVNAEEIVYWLKKAVPKMLKTADETVMYINMGEFERKNGDDVETVVASIMLAWNDGFDYYDDDKYVAKDGWGLTIGLYEKDSSYFVADWNMLNDNQEMSDNFEDIAKWLIKDFTALRNGEKLIEGCCKNEKCKKIDESDECADVTIKLCTCNAAFEDDKFAEVARILRNAAEKIENGNGFDFSLKDSNGNKVGTISSK